MTSHTHAQDLSRDRQQTDAEPNTAPLSFRQVMAATPMGRERYAHLFGNPRWPTAQDVADARAFLAADRAERQGDLLCGQP